LQHGKATTQEKASRTRPGFNWMPAGAERLQASIDRVVFRKKYRVGFSFSKIPTK